MDVMARCVPHGRVSLTTTIVTQAIAALAIESLPADRPAERIPLDGYRVALLGLTILAISKANAYIGVLRPVRPALVLAMLCVLFGWWAPQRLDWRAAFATWPMRLLAALGLTAIASALFGITFGGSAKFIVEEYSKTLLLVVLLVIGVRGTVDLRRIVFAFVFGAGTLAFLAVAVVGLSKTTDAITYDANDVALIMVTTLPLAMLLYRTRRNRFEGIVLIGIVALMLATMAKSGSRGGFLAMVAIGVALFIGVPGWAMRHRIGAIVGAVALLFIAAPAGYWASMGQIAADPSGDYNYSAVDGRRMLWQRGGQYLAAYPVFGVGISNFPKAEGTISSKAALLALSGKGVRWAAPHNSFVQAGAETGFVGLTLWSALVIGMLVAPRRLLSRRRRAVWLASPDHERRFLALLTLYLPIAVLGFAVSGFFVSFAWNEPVYVLAAITAAVTRTVVRLRRRDDASPAVLAPPAARARNAGRRGGLELAARRLA
jgi:hypothetical protein